MTPSHQRTLTYLTHLCCEGRLISRTRDRIFQREETASAPYLATMQQIEEDYARHLTASIAQLRRRVL